MFRLLLAIMLAFSGVTATQAMSVDAAYGVGSRFSVIRRIRK
jgi:hypothetical protein